MQNRKLYHLLALMEEEDIKQFSLFLQAEYFDASRSLFLFWQTWQEKVFPLGKDETLSKEDFIAGTKLKISRFDNYCSQLYLKARQFLAMQSFSEHPHLQNLMLSKALLKRDPFMNVSERLISQMETELQEEAESPEKYLGLIYLKTQFAEAKINARKTSKNWQAEFDELQRLLKLFEKSKNLQLGLALANIGQILNQPDTHTDAPDWESAANGVDLIPRVYGLTLALTMGVDAVSTFAHLLELLKKERSDLSDDVANEIYYHVLNYCIRQINQGNTEFLERTHDLYRVLLENGDLMKNGQISPQQYKNIIALGCRLGRLEWVRSFIDAYLPHLSDDHNGVALAFNEAVLFFHQGRFGNAIRGFKEVIHTTAYDVFYGMDARIYLWKSYFEHWDELNSAEVDDMYRLYDSFRLYIDRNKKISPLHQLQYRNLVRFFKRFMEILQISKGDKQLETMQEFLGELESASDVANKLWFSSKVETALERLKEE